jgi:hypothetical protein
LAAIDGVAITNENYREAVEILQRRFGDVNNVKLAFYAQLDVLPVAINQTRELRHTLDEVDRICRQLGTLGESLNQPTLIMVVQRKFPLAIILELQKQKTPNEMWQMNNFRKELEALIYSREQAERIFAPQGHHHQPDNRCGETGGRGRLAQAMTGGAKGRSPCVFCEGSHFNDECPIVITIDDRRQRAREQQLCFKCLLSSDHMAQHCTINKVCFHCKESHHSALCDRRAEHSWEPMTTCDNYAKRK